MDLRLKRVDPVAVIYIALVVCIAAALCYCKPEPPKPTPVPTPVTCDCTIPPATDPGWEGAAVEVPYTLLFVDAARTAIGDRCDKDENETLALVAQKIREAGVCAAGPWVDAVIVARPDGYFEEIHAVEWARGCWYPLSKAFKGAWQYNGQLEKKGCR